MKLGVDIPLETKISIKHKQEKKNQQPSITKNLWLKVDLFPLFDKHMVCLRYLKCYYRPRISLGFIIKQ